jgi:hypothetical protein
VTFSVDAQGLQGLPVQLDRLSEDAAKGRAYVIDNARMSYGGVLDRISGGHEHVVGSASDFLDRIAHPVAQTSAAAVRASIRYYQQSDHHAAARLDASYPAVEAEGPVDGAPGMSAQGYRSGGVFTDVAEPQDNYREIEDYSLDFPLEPQQLATISMAGYARNIIIEATDTAAKLGFGHHWDPYEAILKPLTGDWAGLRGCKDVFDNVAGALEAMSHNVRNGVLSVHTVWGGNAADSARHHLDEIAGALDEAIEPFTALGEAYETAADGAHELFGALADVINQLVDAVIIFIAEATAAVATSETVIGGIGFGAAAGYEAYQVYETIKDVVECASIANALLETLQSSWHDFGLVDGGIKLPILPDDRPTLPGDQGGVYAPKITAAPPDHSRVPDPGIRPTLDPAPSPQPAPSR